MVARLEVRTPADGELYSACKRVSDCVAPGGEGAFVPAPPLRAHPRTIWIIRKCFWLWGCVSVVSVTKLQHKTAQVELNSGLVDSCKALVPGQPEHDAQGGRERHRAQAPQGRAVQVDPKFAHSTPRLLSGTFSS